MSQSPLPSRWPAGALLAWLSILLAGASVLWWASSFLYEATRVTARNGQVIIVSINSSQKWLDSYAEVEGVWKLAERMQSSGVIRKYHALGFGYAEGVSRGYGGYRIVAIPLWFPTLLLSLPAARFLWLRRRQRHRVERNQCLHCGYDLRSSAGRCPECGTPIPAVPPNEPPARAA